MRRTQAVSGAQRITTVLQEGQERPVTLTGFEAGILTSPLLAGAVFLILLLALGTAGLAVVLWARSLRRLRAAGARERFLLHALTAPDRPALLLDAQGRATANAALGHLLGLPPGQPFSLDRLAEALIARRLRAEAAPLPSLLQESVPALAEILASPSCRDGNEAAGPAAMTVLRFERIMPLADGHWLLVAEPPARMAAADPPEKPAGADGHQDIPLDTWPLPAWRRDRTGRLIAVNESYCRAVGAGREEVLANQIELVEEQLHGTARELAEEAMRSGAAREKRVFAVLAGERRALRLIEIPLGSTGSFGVAFDVTEIEDLRAEVHQLIRSHAATLDRLTTGVLLFDANQRLAFFNAAFLRLMRLDEDWLATHPTHGEVLDALRERRRIPEQADYQAWKHAQLERHRQLEGSEELWHLPDETSLRVLTEPHPEGGLLVLFEDVTDRLALERSYNTLIAVQRETLNHLHEAVAVFGPDARLKLFNPAYVDIWGLDPAYLEGEPHFGEMLDQILALWAEQAPTPAQGDKILALKDNLLNQVIAHIPLSGRWHRPDGRVLDYAVVPLPDGRVLTTHMDVTDSFRIEQALRERNEALETADRLKSEFVANMSYELRTPLNTIMGFAELLSHGIAGSLSARQREYLGHVIAAASELKRLIDDILDLATIEAGVFELAIEPIDVPALLETVRQMAKDAARKAGVRLAIEVPSGLERIEGDRRRLVHALYNLVRNGIQFTPEGGCVTLFARPGMAAGMEIGVRDTGIGISEEERHRVFEKFYRGTSARKRGGAGLGLALVRSFVELHRGTVTIDSAPGHGTTVILTLPHRQPQPRSAAGSPAAHADVSQSQSLAERP